MRRRIKRWGALPPQRRARGTSTTPLTDDHLRRSLRISGMRWRWKGHRRRSGSWSSWGLGADQTEWLLSFVFSFCSFSLAGKGKKIGEPQFDGWILRLRGWVLNGDRNRGTPQKQAADAPAPAGPLSWPFGPLPVAVKNKSLHTPSPRDAPHGDAPDEGRWEASLSHMSRDATEARPRATAEWIDSHVRAGRRYWPPPGRSLRRNNSAARGSPQPAATTSSSQSTGR